MGYDRWRKGEGEGRKGWMTRPRVEGGGLVDGEE